MGRSSDPAKVAQWQRRLERFASSSLSVARFCEREEVSVASFYHWRKKLTDAETANSPRRHRTSQAPVFRPVTVVPAAHAVTIHLPGGARVEVPAENLNVVRTVVDELVRADRTLQQMQASPPDQGGAPC